MMRTHSFVRGKRPLLLAVGLAAASFQLTAPAAATSTAAAKETALSPEAPITSVVVYSDRARVTRSARLTLAGTQQVTLPLLQGSIEPSSIRMEAQGAEVLRVQTSYVDASELPVDEAQRLLKSLEKVDDDLSRVQSERGVYAAQLELLRRMLPTVPPAPSGGPEAARPPARLNASGWATVLTFLRTAQEKLQLKLSEGEEQLHTLRRQRQELVDKARLLGGIAHRAGYRVIATLAGQGAAQVALTYMTAGARWLPTYDIQLLPAKNRVELALAGLVSQETGEDWSDVALTLSTAVPATATQLPKLLTWKIGERERFIPTPQPMTEVTPPPPPSPPLPSVYSAVEQLRAQLLARSGLADAKGRRIQLVDELEATAEKDRDKSEFDQPRRSQAGGEAALQRMATATPAPMPVQAPPPPAPEPIVMSRESTLSEGPDHDADGIPDMEDQTVQLSGKAQRSRPSFGRSGRRSAEVVGVGLAPPPAYQAPHYASNLPAALAGGYDLSYPGLAKDSIKSGQGSRRVALLARSFPVVVTRKLMPALAPEAFLVAEIKNPATEPLPGGQANLFVGADPAGVATLKLVAAGETFTLPLGLDRAVKPIRNVRMTTEEKGVFSKDEVTEYVVTTEVSNPYQLPIELKILDQIPLPGNKNIEIKLLRSLPPAQHDPIHGALEWKLSLQPGGKAVTQFVYTLRRPKGYRLTQ